MNALTRWLERQGPRIDWVMRVVAFLATGAMIVLYADFRGYVDCQAGVNEALIARTKVLTEVNDQERVAQRAADNAAGRLFTDPVVSKPADQRTQPEREHLAALFRDYQAALTRLQTELAAADKARADNPPPEPPSQACG